MELPATRKEKIAPTRSALAAAVRRRVEGQGYVHARSEARDSFLFFKDGIAWCAGASDAEAPAALSVARFVEELAGAYAVDVCDTDLPLFLCAAVVFRKPPAVHVPTSMIDGDQLLRNIEQLGKDVVLALHAEGFWALAFCRGGEPVALYAAGALMTPAATSITESVLELAVTHKDIVIDLYDEIRVPRAPDAGQNADELEGLLAPERARPVLVVMLGDRVVFRHQIDREETVVGRGPEAHLALDNLSISRKHAVIRVDGDRVVVEDCGSENGVVVRGQKVPRAELKPGESVAVGKYTLVYATYADAVARAAPLSPAATSAAKQATTAVSSDLETINISQRRGAVLEHAGARVPIKSVVFTIGSAPEANLRVRGLLIAGIHAVIEPALDGGYVLRREGKARALRVNGDVVERHALKHGDEIAIAGETMRFVLT